MSKFNKVVHHDFTSDTRFNKRYIIVSLQVIYMVIQVVFIQVDLVQQWWFHKWSSTLSDQFKSRKLSSSRRAQDSSRLTKHFDIGGGAPLQSIKVKDPTSILHVAFQGDLHASTCCCYKWCQFQSNWKCPSKMKIQDSTIYPSPTLCIKPQMLHMIAYKGCSSGNPISTRGTTSSGSHWSSHGQFHVVSAFLWSLMTKGERNEQRYELSLDDKGEMRWECDHGHGSRGSIFLDKRSTQVGGASSWTWLLAFDMCIFMCLLAFA